MRPSQALQTYREQIRSVVLAHRATNARVFGSVVRGEDTDVSDLDLLIDPTPETSLMDIGAIRLELKTLLGISLRNKARRAFVFVVGSVKPRKISWITDSSTSY